MEPGTLVATASWRPRLARWGLVCAPVLWTACGSDSTGPIANGLTVTLTAPSPGPVQGTITVQADAEGTRHVAGVQFILDESNLGPEVTQPPYSTHWDTGESAVGTHQLSARARDDAGNTATAAAIAVTIELGTEIAFVSQLSPGNDEIFIVNADGSGLRRLTRRDGQEDRPQWTAGGQRLFFHATGRETDGGDGLYTMDPDGTNVQLVLKNPPGAEHTLSPDGQRIAFTTTHSHMGGFGSIGELDVMNADGSGKITLVNFDTVPCLTSCIIAASPSWRPDGAQLAFSTSIFGHGGATFRGLYIVNRDGTGLHWVADDAEEPAWSSDGQSLAYSSWSSSIIPHSANLGILGIGLITSDTDPEIVNTSPSWSADGSRLVFVRSGTISIINVDGTGLRTVTGGRSPVWNQAAR